MKKHIFIYTLIFCLFSSCSKKQNQTIILNPPIKPVIIEDPIKEKKLTPPIEKIPLETLSHKYEAWGIGKTSNEVIPNIPNKWRETLDKYNGFFLGISKNRKVYLTFDCGYEAGYTEDIINVLVKNKVPAIFFIVGHYIDSRPDLVKKMVDNGFLIGNHTVNHAKLPTLTEAEIKKEVLDLNESIKKLTGKETTYFRPPSGDFSNYSMAIIKNLGFKTIFWSLALRDWIPLPGGAEESYKTIMERIHPGAIILLHSVSKDNHGAMQRIIDGIRAKGYEFAPIDF